MRLKPGRVHPNLSAHMPTPVPSLTRRIVRALLILLVVSSIGIAWRPVLGEGYDTLIFVVGITIIGALEGLSLAVISAVLAALIFNFFVAEPLFDLSFSKETDFATAVVFAVCAVVSGMLSGRMHDQARQMQQTNLRQASLLTASGKLQQANNGADVFSTLSDSVGGPLGIALGLYRFDGSVPQAIGGSPADGDWIAAAAALMACHEEHAQGGGFAGWALGGNDVRLGGLIAKTDGVELDDSFMLALARVVALALARTQLAAHLAESRARAISEDLKSALLSSVSHDLRSPLTAINASAASLLAFGDHFDRDTMRELLDSIITETDRLSTITTNLLEMSRMEAGQSALRLSVLPATEIIRNTVNRHKRSAGGQKLSFAAPPDEILIEVDAVLFDLVLTNVIQNAQRYSPPGGTIAVACAVDGPDCMITVIDNGIGIPAKDQARVFERFYRVRRSGEVPRGSGLGLAIAHSFVKASHGSIAIKSPLCDGHGTVVSIRLPLAPAGPNVGDLAAMIVEEEDQMNKSAGEG